MKQRLYRSGQFARKAAVSVRTLRYYDRVGLLRPTQYSDAGYRLYADTDLARLQQILALKFLGFSLDEIKDCLAAGPRNLRDMLAVQKAMMREKRAHIDTIIAAIEKTEKVLQQDCQDWTPIVRIMEALQMDQKDDWQSKYFTPEQRQTMDELSKMSYGAEARQKLAARSGQWTEEDQRRVDEQYAWIGRELRRLVATGADPASPEAQAVAKVQDELLCGFTRGDPDITAGLCAWWKNFHALPGEQRPFTPPYSGAENEFMQKALAIYRRRQEREAQ